MTAYNALLPVQKLPKSLWDQEQRILRLPDSLAHAYETLIERHHLRDLAQSKNSGDSPAGGIDKDSTDAHFAQMFDNSAARAQLAITNATRGNPRVSNALIQILSGNRVCITDAPCGAGAASFAFLCAVAELRADDILPRLPLTVHIIGAEISEYARNYAAELMEELRPSLEAQAMFVEIELRHWDVMDALSNTDLIQHMILTSKDVSKRLVVVANFSSFLSQSKKQEQASRQLEEIFRHASTAESFVVWIEPQVNAAIRDGGLLSKLTRWAEQKWHRFVRVNTDGEDIGPYITDDVQFRSNMTPDRLRTVRLAVMRLDLARQP